MEVCPMHFSTHKKEQNRKTKNIPRKSSEFRIILSKNNDCKQMPSVELNNFVAI
jgi:hypothetical protein